MAGIAHRDGEQQSGCRVVPGMDPDLKVRAARKMAIPSHRQALH
jgi:hypothetical protein